MRRLAKRQKAVRKSIIAGVSSVIPSQSVLVTQNTLLSIVNNAKTSQITRTGTGPPSKDGQSDRDDQRPLQTR